MKKILPFLLAALLLFSSCNLTNKAQLTNNSLSNEANSAESDTTITEHIDERSYVESLALEKANQLGLMELPPEQAIQTTYDYLIETMLFHDPVGLDCWRYLSEETQPIPYIENRSLSPLLFNIASCEDFAAVLVMLLNSAGIDAEYVAGFTLSKDQVYIDHAWLIVNWEGDWYHLDPQLEQNVVRNNRLNYRYFMKTDAEMIVDHKWGENLVEFWSDMPAQEQSNILENYSYPPCDTVFPQIESKYTGLPLSTNLLAIELEIEEIRKKPLPPIHLNVEPPILVEAHHITPPLLTEEYTGEIQASQRHGESFLNQNQLNLYSQIKEVLRKPADGLIFQPEIRLGDQEAQEVIDYFFYDHAEYYWAEILPAKPEDYSSLILKLVGQDSLEDILEKTKILEAKADQILEPYKNKSDFEKALAIHDYLGINLTYDYGFKIKGSDNAYGAIVEHVAYCDGYARGFQYLAQRAGIDNVYVTGRDNHGTAHAWNGVELNGSWYYVDVTWDRASTSYGGAYHDFFTISLKDSMKERIWDDSQYPNLPASDSKEYSFYDHYGYIIELDGNTNAYNNTDEIAEIIINQLSKKDNLNKAFFYSFIEFRVIGNDQDFLEWKNTFNKEAFNIAKTADALAVERNLPFRVSYDSKLACYYNNSMQIVAFYPTVKKL